MVPETLTDLSPAGLIAAVEADNVATRLYNGDVPVDPRAEPDVAWAMPVLASEMRATVVRADFDPSLADARLDAVLATADEAGAAVTWWLAAHHRPADLAQRLARRGFGHVDDTAAMAIDLRELPSDAGVPDGVLIELVDDLDDVEAYVGILLKELELDHPPVSPDAGPARVRHLAGRLGNDPASRRFVAWLDGRPVATSRLSMAGGAAGLYTVITLPEARGRGIGRATTLAALLAGREAGMRIGVLQATEAGYGIYRRLGFRDLFEYRMLARPAAVPAD